jgi:hypothetical protein
VHSLPEQPLLKSNSCPHVASALSQMPRLLFLALLVARFLLRLR